MQAITSEVFVNHLDLPFDFVNGFTELVWNKCSIFSSSLLIALVFFGLDLVKIQAEAVEFFLAFVILGIGVSQVSAEDLPVAAKVGERGV